MNTNLLNTDNVDTYSINEQIIVSFFAVLILLLSLLIQLYKKYLIKNKKEKDNKTVDFVFLLLSIASVLLFAYLVYMNIRNLNNLNSTDEKIIAKQKELLIAKIVALSASIIELDIAIKNYKAN